MNAFSFVSNQFQLIILSRVQNFPVLYQSKIPKLEFLKPLKKFDNLCICTQKSKRQTLVNIWKALIPRHLTPLKLRSHAMLKVFRKIWTKNGGI